MQSLKIGSSDRRRIFHLLLNVGQDLVAFLFLQGILATNLARIIASGSSVLGGAITPILLGTGYGGREWDPEWWVKFGSYARCHSMEVVWGI